MKSLLTGIVFAIILASGVIAYSFLNNSVEDASPGVESSDPAPQAEILSPEQIREKEMGRAIVITNSAIVASDPSQCQAITIPDIQVECLEKSQLALALRENDPLLCEKLSIGGQIECKDQIYFRIAQDSGLPEDCAKITNSGVLNKCSQDIELALLAAKRSDVNPSGEKLDCDDFTNPLAIEQCKADLRLSEDQSQLEKAINTKNLDICESISSTNLRDDCRDGVHFSDAKASRNIDLCEKIRNIDIKTQCLSTVSDFSDSTLFQRAIEKQSSKECEGILAQEMRQSCIDRIRVSEIVKSGKKEDCLTIEDMSLRESCTLSF